MHDALRVFTAATRYAAVGWVDGRYRVGPLRPTKRAAQLDAIDPERFPAGRSTGVKVACQWVEAGEIRSRTITEG